VDPTATLTTVLLTSPVAGAAGLVVGIVILNAIKAWLPAFMTASSSAKPPPETEPARGWQVAVGETAEAAEEIVAALRAQVEVLRRETEAVERIERTLAIWLAQQERGAPRSPAPPRRPTPAT